MSERITGHTELIGLFATPIRHSISPQMHNEAFARLGLDYAYLAFEVGKEELPAALDGVGKISVFNAKDAFFTTASDKIASIKAETGCDIQLHDLADEDLLRQEMATSAILVNATGVGMKPLEGQSLITDASLLRSDLVVADVIYTPSETALLKLAKAQGCQTLNGLGMLIGQGAAAFKLWTGKEMPVAEIKELLF
ncbi:hypothetical protein CYV26_13925 [Carnobacterium maltaromaticum]|uniref:hypothetical protein n=1 Tax=Carnobacterium maltaromaticum TaxID=2751 RepID=UPI000C775BA1|nr:hypothetical protein [Carnobacterium maltaromaticum]PLS33152.1 hypothetical protein CYV33_13900 [Carnobacterium maltaromaticum]PLS33727.1 hypothetical protein CYV30_13710 [Carnobacterium maltaromaticum]PLS33898.1 hypothetical protein CYV31_12715 [Carnobacterium maltaromaticum]PLS41237.1 hypothetical protein CYV28_12675 [Carnobacterium maltaromaticum]PLS42308.1 hypothetical protein CYV27_13355 [Carnobacterium maltaromaticum]